MQDMPYFMTNKEWYGYDYKRKRFFCTNKAPEKAKQSLNEFYKIEKEINNGKR